MSELRVSPDMEVRVDFDRHVSSSVNLGYVEPVQSATMTLGAGFVKTFDASPKTGERVTFPVINGQGEAIIEKRRRLKGGAIRLWLGPVTITRRDA